MKKKIQLENIELKIYSGRTFYIIIDIFKFVKDHDLRDIQVFIVGDEDACIDEINIISEVEDIYNLKEEALKWIIKHVEIKEDSK